MAEGAEPPVIRRVVRLPDRSHRGDVIIGSGAAVFKGHPERVELFFQPANPNAKAHASAGQRVEGGDLLR